MKTNTKVLKAGVGAVMVVLLYVGSYLLNALFGGYWLKPERDGRHRWDSGLSMHTAYQWQPRFGYQARYTSDIIGTIYAPLILLDRKLRHQTHYLNDDTFWEWVRNLPDTEKHPFFRAGNRFIRDYVQDFGVHWPPRESMDLTGTRHQPLLNGRAKLVWNQKIKDEATLSVTITLTRPAHENRRVFWNKRLAFPDYDWMSQVRTWDEAEQWLWPNLPFLLRLHGKERVERYGGVDPGKGVDNDFAAVLVRTYDASGKALHERVSADWAPPYKGITGLRTLIHTARLEMLTIPLTADAPEGAVRIWLIYADFLGAKPPASWPREGEYAGGILAYFEARWIRRPGMAPEVDLEQMVPPEATGFDWVGWADGIRKKY